MLVRIQQSRQIYTISFMKWRVVMLSTSESGKTWSLLGVKAWKDIFKCVISSTWQSLANRRVTYETGAQRHIALVQIQHHTHIN